MERLFGESELAWTMVRPPELTDKQESGASGSEFLRASFALLLLVHQCVSLRQEQFEISRLRHIGSNYSYTKGEIVTATG